jgi:hypothetical protein
MPTYQINRNGVAKAEKLIDAGQYDLTTPWSEAAPSAAAGNDQIDRHGYDGYGEWFLAVDADASEGTKERDAFPYGDFHRVNRAALIHAKQRASQNDHEEIVKAADRLLKKIDGD